LPGETGEISWGLGKKVAFAGEVAVRLEREREKKKREDETRE